MRKMKLFLSTILLNMVLPLFGQSFEGTLLYITNEYHSDAVKKYSYGSAYNGNRIIQLTLKDNAVHIFDKVTHIHEIIDLDKNVAVIYSDLTREGVNCGVDYMLMKRGQFSNSSKNVRVNFHDTGSKEYKGDVCQMKKGTIESLLPNITTNGNIEIWYSNKLIVSPAYNYFLCGAEASGVVKKWIYMSNTASPIGDLRSVASSELMAIDTHPVYEEEITYPEDIKFLSGNAIKTVQDLYKNNNKELKKMGLAPKDDDNESKYAIEEEWDFVKQWESEVGEPGKVKHLFSIGDWTSLGLGLITDVVKAVSIISPNSQIQTDVEPERSSTSNGSKAKSKVSSKQKSCSHCFGTGICNYCNGDGYNYVTGEPVKCKACCKDCNQLGRCKWCKGEGHL